jgi:hypothetical protein
MTAGSRRDEKRREPDQGPASTVPPSSAQPTAPATHFPVSSQALAPGGSTHVGSFGGHHVHGAPHTSCAHGSHGGGHFTFRARVQAPVASHAVGPGGAQVGSAGAQGLHDAPQASPKQGSWTGGQSAPVHGHAMGPLTQLPCPSHCQGSGPSGQAGSELAQAGTHVFPHIMPSQGGGAGGGQGCGSGTQACFSSQ